MKKIYTILIISVAIISSLGIITPIYFHYTSIYPCNAQLPDACEKDIKEFPIVQDWLTKYSDYEDSVSFFGDLDGSARFNIKDVDRTASMIMKFWNGEPIFVKYYCFEKQEDRSVTLYEKFTLPKVSCFDYKI